MEQHIRPDDPDLIEVLNLIGAMDAPLQAFLSYLRRERRWPAPQSLNHDPLARPRPS